MRGNRLKCEFTLKQMMTNEMTINLNMFSMFMEDIIMSNLNSTSIITVKFNFSGIVNTKIL